MTALTAMPFRPACQHFEQATKGSLEVGKLADLVILSANPVKVDPETIDQIKVVETIKERKTIYAAN
jgi:predicted amidohydrolase YtcJ